MIVTGRVVLTPSVVNNSVQLGQAAVVTSEALQALHAQAPVNVFLVRFKPAADHSRALQRMRADFPGTVLTAVRPPDIENLRRVDHLPGLLAALFALIAFLTVGNTLATQYANDSANSPHSAPSDCSDVRCRASSRGKRPWSRSSQSPSECPSERQLDAPRGRKSMNGSGCPPTQSFPERCSYSSRSAHWSQQTSPPSSQAG